MSTLTDEILRRHTFAIISHPDLDKTTLTEKLLLFGGAIQLAGEVKARGERRRVRLCRRDPTGRRALADFGDPDERLAALQPLGNIAVGGGDDLHANGRSAGDPGRGVAVMRALWR